MKEDNDLSLYELFPSTAEKIEDSKQHISGDFMLMDFIKKIAASDTQEWKSVRNQGKIKVWFSSKKFSFSVNAVVCLT